MPRVAVLTDSSSDLSPSQAQQYGLFLLHLSVRFHGREWVDHLQLSAGEMFDRMARDRLEELPSIQVPTLEDYLGFVEKLLQTHDHVFALHTSPLIGRVYQMAFHASQATPDRLTVFNSNSTSGGMALQAIRARQLFEQGHSVPEVMAVLRRLHQQQFTRLCVTTLTGFRRAGLVGRVQAFIGEKRELKPILTIQQGKLEVLQVERGPQDALHAMLREFRQAAQGTLAPQVIFGFNGDPSALDELKAAAWELGVHEITEVQFGAVLSSITGPNAYGFNLEPRLAPPLTTG